jgi:hypothetical protein
MLTISASVAVAQHARVETARHANAIPKVCESVVAAKIADPIDIPALVKEAYCKGSGDMLSEYTYVTHSTRREKDKKGKEKLETFTFDVFFPTLKSGAHTKGILVVTSHNGVPVPANELEKERARAAERTEKEEEKLAREAPVPPIVASDPATGMLPLGVYGRSASNRETLGGKYSAQLSVRTFLKTCDLSLARREQIEGRETLIFTFAPRPDAQFADNERYIAQLAGEIWIDAADRIVTRLAGWPAKPPAISPSSGNAKAAPAQSQTAGEATADARLPAVLFEMMRLPKQGLWFPRATRINGADYQKLFDGITTDSSSTYSDYIRFSAGVQDATIGEPAKP